MLRSLLLLCAILAMATSFTPSHNNRMTRHRATTTPTKTTTTLNIDMGEPERASLTRDSEPDEFFSTNTDKMSDADKFPIAIAGLVGISLPFIAGMIALYAAK